MSKHKSRPLLSIGIIFKNEIRCLERCVKSFDSLRKTIPCELVMADTGADDGSREIAEKYADILIDFPWINDFAAARNAVMDQCSGIWYLTVDADEWLDDDFDELVAFLRDNNKKIQSATVLIRNYFNAISADSCSDFSGVRLLRMSTGLRYQNPIHEYWPLGSLPAGSFISLRKTVLHHDGYMNMGEVRGKEKIKRNLALLQEDLKRNPDSLRTTIQYIESALGESDCKEHIRRGLALVEAKKPEWDFFGPPLFRHGVNIANTYNLPEFEDWIVRAEELFPNSFFTLLDVQYIAFFDSLKKMNYSDCIARGERFLKAYDDYKEGRGDQNGAMASGISTATAYHQRRIEILLAGLYLVEHQVERSLEILKSVHVGDMDTLQTINLVETLTKFPSIADRDVSDLVIRFWNDLCESKQDKVKAVERKTAFIKRAVSVFEVNFCEKEKQKEDFSRHAYTVFLPLLGKCELGTAAAILESDSAEEIASYLHQVEDWNLMPESALSHALEMGVPFPLPDKPLALEEMDALAIRLSANRDGLFKMALETDGKSYPTMQGLSWARALTLAAVQVYNWKDGEKGVELARAFTALQKELLRRTYTEEMLREENVCQLPSMLRFSWYCIRAFEALDTGDPAGYVRRLREGLSGMPAMKEMVEFLAERSKEVQELVTPPELLELAAQVRMMLAAYPANDPAVAALKQSEAYQKVAYLLDTGSIQ